MEQKLKIAGQFDIEGTVSGIAPVGNGLINDTYSVTTAETNTPDYILQRINHHIFKDVELLQRNIQRVTDHIRAKLEASDESDIDRKALKLVPAKDGKLYHFDGENYWRMTVMIPRSVTHETMTPTLAEQTGMAFGNFQSQLSDLPEGALGETIPNFHNIEFRVEGFKESIARDSAGAPERRAKTRRRDTRTRRGDVQSTAALPRQADFPNGLRTATRKSIICSSTNRESRCA